MIDSNAELPKSVCSLNVEGKDIYLVGTAHVSKESVEDVRSTIEAVKPDSVCVELCPARHRTIIQGDNWQNTNIFKVIKEKKAVLLLAQLIMSSFYRRLGDKLGIKPGAEMLEGIALAEKTGAELVLADRDIQITLKRVWGYLGFWNKLKLTASVMVEIFARQEIDAELIEKIKKQDQLESIMAEFAESFPEIKKRLIDERDVFLAQKIRQAPGSKIVAVVGAGHVEGIQKHIHKDEPLDELLQTPPKSIVPRILKWLIPAAIIALLVVGFFKGGGEHSMQSIYIWVFVNGSLSALGAILALGHPLTVAACFIGAPLTSLNPMIAAGWVAGLVQACVRKPAVNDFKDLPDAVSTVKGYWINPVTKILLVMAFANIGSILGTIIATGWISAR